MGDAHARLEVARDNPDERQPVPMLRVHVRLDLEDEPGEPRIQRIHGPSGRVAWPRRRGHIEKGPEERLDPEIGQRAAKEDRRLVAGQKRVTVEWHPGRAEQLDLLAQALDRLRAKQFRGGRSIEGQPLDLRAPRPVPGIPVKQLDDPGAQVVDAHELRLAMHRPGHRAAGQAKIAFHVPDQLQRIRAGAIALVDEGDDGNAPTAADVEQLPSAFFDPLAVVEQHDGAVGGDEGPVGVFPEVLVAGGVQQVDVPARPLELQHTGGDGNAPLLLQLHPVRGGVPLGAPGLDRPGQVDRPPVEEELFRQRGLARVGVADDGKGSAARNVRGGGGNTHFDSHPGNGWLARQGPPGRGGPEVPATWPEI